MQPKKKPTDKKIKNLRKKAIEDLPLLLFTIILIGAIVLFIVLVKNKLLTENYNIHSGEQNIMANLLGNSKHTLISGISNENSYNTLELKNFNEDFIKNIIDLENRQIAFKVEVLDLQGKSIIGPFYSNKDKYDLYSAIAYSGKYDVTESRFLVKKPNPVQPQSTEPKAQLNADQTDAVLVITTTYATFA